MPMKLRNSGVCCFVWVILQAFSSVHGRNFWQQSFCHGRDNGNYADPLDCRAYYQCSFGSTTYIWRFTTGLMFDKSRESTSWAWETQCPITKVYREVWWDIDGDAMYRLVNDTKFPCSPNTTSLLDTFCLYKINGYGTDYGQRLRSFLKAPLSGPYVFETSCDNGCEVWLSSDHTPTRKRKIIDQRRWLGRARWNKSSEQVAAPVHLIKDNVYYLELLHKQGKGWNFACLGMKTPGSQFSHRPISSRYLELSADQISSFKCPTKQPSTEVSSTDPPTQPPSVDEMSRYLKNNSEQLKEKLRQGPPPGNTMNEHIEHVMQEYTALVDKMLEGESGEEWRSSNDTNLMDIALITEEFGTALMESWNNDTAPLIVISSTLMLEVSVLQGRNYKFPDDQANSAHNNWTGAGDSIQIKLTDHLDTQSSRSSAGIKVFSVLYKNLNEHVTYNHLGDSKKKLGPQSRIISSLLSSSSTPYGLLVSIHFRNIKNNSSANLEPVCCWWDPPLRDNNSGGGWSSNGCSMSSHNDTHTTCTCNHLTNFAVLMQVREGHNKDLSTTHQRALSIITYVGCTLSLIGVTLTTLIFSCTSGLRSKRNLIHLNLSINIGILQVIFLAGIEATANLIACRLVAALLHYFCLVSFAWMLVEGVFLYIMVVNVFDSHKDYMKLYIGCSYGVPALLVIISVSIAHEGYGNEAVCWLSIKNGVIYALVVPALFCILVNTVILFLVIKEIIQVQNKGATGDKSALNNVRSGLKSAIVLLPLLGLTWLFGVLALSEDTIVMQYLFAICNSLQGFFIFILHCALNSEVRRALDRSREVWFSKHGAFLTTGSLSQPSSSRTGKDSVEKSTNDLGSSKQTELSSKTTTSPRDRRSSYTEVTINQNRKYYELESEALDQSFVCDNVTGDFNLGIDQPITKNQGSHSVASTGSTRNTGKRGIFVQGGLPSSSKRSSISPSIKSQKLAPLKNAPKKKEVASRNGAPRRPKAKDKRPLSRSAVQPTKHV